MDELDRLLAPPGDELDSLLAPNSASAQPPVTGGFRAAAKQAVGATIKGAGQLAADVAPSLVSQDNALKQYGQEVTEANPTKVQGFRDIVENPGTTVAEATGNAAGSIGAMLGMRALGTGITAATPLAGPAAPIVAGAGQLVSWGGPALVAALPSFGGIRGKQIEKDPTAAGDFKDKAIAALGAATVGIIESKFGPQDWALKLTSEAGRKQLAGMLADTTVMKAIGSGAVKGGAIEGAEEIVQNPVEQLASGDNPLTKESLTETAFGGVMGAVGGGVLGGAMGPAMRPRAQEVLDDTPSVDPVTDRVSGELLTTLLPEGITLNGTKNSMANVSFPTADGQTATINIPIDEVSKLLAANKPDEIAAALEWVEQERAAKIYNKTKNLPVEDYSGVTVPGTIEDKTIRGLAQGGMRSAAATDAAKAPAEQLLAEAEWAMQRRRAELYNKTKNLPVEDYSGVIVPPSRQQPSPGLGMRFTQPPVKPDISKTPVTGYEADLVKVKDTRGNEHFVQKRELAGKGKEIARYTEDGRRTVTTIPRASLVQSQPAAEPYTRLPDDPARPGTVQYNVRGEVRTFAPAEGMSKAEVEEALAARKGPGSQVAWLQKNTVEVTNVNPTKSGEVPAPAADAGGYGEAAGSAPQRTAETGVPPVSQPAPEPTVPANEIKTNPVAAGAVGETQSLEEFTQKFTADFEKNRTERIARLEYEIAGKTPKMLNVLGRDQFASEEDKVLAGKIEELAQAKKPLPDWYLPEEAAAAYKREKNDIPSASAKAPASPPQGVTSSPRVTSEFRTRVGDTEQYGFSLYDGKKLVGEGSYSIGPDGTAKIGKVAAFAGANSLGAGVVKSMRAELVKQNPKIKKFVGDRVSGAKVANAPKPPTLPGVKYDGKNQFTITEGTAKGASFTAKDLSPESVQAAHDKTVARFSAKSAAKTKVTLKEQYIFDRGMNDGAQDAALSTTVDPEKASFRAGYQKEWERQAYRKGYLLGQDEKYRTDWKDGNPLTKSAINRGDIEAVGFEAVYNGRDTSYEETKTAPKASVVARVAARKHEMLAPVLTETIAEDGTKEFKRVPSLEAYTALAETRRELDPKAKIDDRLFYELASMSEKDYQEVLPLGSVESEMVAFHGTPHTVDKFSMSKVGTGEGAQAYGHGLYFAGAKKIAQWYRDKLSKEGYLSFDGEKVIGFDSYGNMLVNSDFRTTKIKVPAHFKDTLRSKFIAYKDTPAKLYEYIFDNLTTYNKESSKEAAEFFDKLELHDSKGKLYQVELAPQEDEYLLWDRPLSEQSEKVKAALASVIDFWAYREGSDPDSRENMMSTMKGERLYNADEIWKEIDESGAMSFDGDKSVSEYLHSLGIRGIKYLDGTSRGKGEGNFNYVIFNEDDISILSSEKKTLGGDPDAQESLAMQAGLEGKSALEATKFLIDNAPTASNRIIAEKVRNVLQRLTAQGITFNFKIAHVGDQVPASLANARGLSSTWFNKTPMTVDVWLNGADVTGKSGMAYEVALHEFIHAATQAALHLGNRRAAAGTATAKAVADLYAVTNEIIAHFNARIEANKNDMGNLTRLERAIFNKRTNALANPHEILAWTLSNKEMQEYLETIKSGPETLWSKFVSSIRTLLGLPVSSNTALAKVLAASETIFDAPVLEMLQAAKTGTPATVAQTTAMNVEDAASKIQNLPAFKKWFAGSKVVDTDGAPLVVYHGTDLGNFSSFDTSQTGASWFAVDPSYASDHAMYKYRPTVDKKLITNPKVYPVYLQVNNPFDFGFRDSETTVPIKEMTERLKAGVMSSYDSGNIDKPTALKLVERLRSLDTKYTGAEKYLRAYEWVNTEPEIVGVLKESGYDGMISREGGKGAYNTYAVFSPTQIKSIFNQTWDGSNPDIAAYESVESQMISSLNTAVKDARTTAANALASLNNPKDALHDKWLQHAPKVLAVTPLSHLAQTYGKTIHWIKDLAKHTNELEATTTRLIDDFFAIHEEAVKAAESETGIDKFNRAMLVATFNQMNPTRELSKQDWVSDKLPPGQQIVAAQKSWVDAGMQKATGMTFTQAYAESKKEYEALGPKTQKQMVEIAKYLGKLRDMDRDASLAFIEKVSKEGSDLRKSLMEQFNNSFSRLKGMYFPLSRYGTFVLQFTGTDGRPVIEQFDSIRERKDAMLTAIANGADEASIVLRMQDENPAGAVAIPSELLTKLREAITTQYMTDVDKKDKEAVAAVNNQIEAALAGFNQTVLRWLPDTSALKNSMTRKSVLGANPDMLRSVNGYVQRHAGRIAWSTVGRQIEDDIAGFANENKEMAKAGDVDLTMRGHLLNNSRMWLQAVQKERVSALTSHIGKLMTGYFMTSPSTFLVQMTQLPTLTLPHLAVKYKSYGKAASAMSTALGQAFSKKFAKEAMRGDARVNEVYDAIHRKVSHKDRTAGKAVGTDWFTQSEKLAMVGRLTGYQKQLLALREAESRNLLDISAVHEAIDVSQGNQQGMLGKAMRLAMLPMQHGELASRKAAILASYQLASTGKKDFFEAMDETADVIDKTIYNFSKRDKGWLMQKDLMRIPFTFQTYRIKTALRLGLLFRDSLRAFKEGGMEKGLADAATKEFLGIFATTGALAGTLGVPFAGTAMAIVQLLFGGDDDEPKDKKLEYTNALTETFGQTLGDILAYGLPTVAGVNLSRRIGMGDIYGASSQPPEQLHGAGLAAWWAGNLIGPSYSIAESWVKGYDEIMNKGNYMKGLETASPKPIKDIFKAIRTATDGVKDGAGKKLLDDSQIGPDEILMIALGFAPDEITRAQNAERSLRGISGRISTRRGRMIRQAAEGVIDGDASDALAEIREFNAKMPRFAIGGRDIKPAVRKILKGELGTTGRRQRDVATQYQVPVFME